MHFYQSGQFVIYITLGMASFDVYRPGWLDKMVVYHKNKLFEDFQKVPLVKIKVTIQPAPKGYVDSPDWDFDSITRLLYLIRESESALAVRSALLKLLGNSRRKMTFQQSVKAFPSLGKKLSNDMYYDVYSSEMYGDVVTEKGFVDDSDNGVILVTNPVESRLPSAMISISLLRKILEERAKAGRYMHTTRKTIPWKPMTKTITPAPAQNVTNQDATTTSAGTPGAPDNHTGSTRNTAAPATGTTAGVAQTTIVQ